MIATCRIMINNNDEQTHFFRKIYLTNFILEKVAKGLQNSCYWLCVRGELETELTATYWPQVPLTIAALLPHSAGLFNRGPEGPSPLSGAGFHCLKLQLELQLTQTVCGTWLYNCLMSTCFLWVYVFALNSTTSTGQGDTPISSTRCTCFLIDGWVKGQYVTKL